MFRVMTVQELCPLADPRTTLNCQSLCIKGVVIPLISGDSGGLPGNLF